ncbi:MAG TPA: DUF2277 domain-containing protein [Candidatus Saccharimonadales bacterium]|nr:DUF2277 domain-containing protein [Candidatus Saccharimonadales bacterium]
MCRNIRPLFNYDPPATDKEIHDAALQFVRKVSGFHTPSQANEKAFNEAIEDISKVVQRLVDSLTTTAPAHNREEEAAKAHERAMKRFGLTE